jgi:hypothetical protein
MSSRRRQNGASQPRSSPHGRASTLGVWTFVGADVGLWTSTWMGHIGCSQQAGGNRHVDPQSYGRAIDPATGRGS